MTTEELEKAVDIGYKHWKKMSKSEKKRFKEKKIEFENKWEKTLYKEYNVENNSKRTLCFGIAWEYSHSGGYSEVEDYFSRLVDLIN